MDKVDLIWIILFSLFIYLLVLVLCLFKGITWCKQNNIWGVVVIFIPLNIIGLIVGILLINNAKHGKYQQWLEDKKEFNKFLNSKELKLKDYLNAIKN